jgi:hypothetical protein
MPDDYLWDPSGAPDLEIARLERLLSGFRHRGRPPLFAIPPAAPARTTDRAWPYPPAASLIAASLVLAVAALVLGVRPRAAAWTVTALDGRPVVDRLAVDRQGTLAVGQWLVTDASARATIDIDDVGSVEVAPNSRIRLVSAHPGDNRIALAHGTVRAMIFAPPRQFAIESASATAIDLGCVYTMQVGADGAGLLHVETGWVAFVNDGRESFVPAGASARTRQGFGPGTPYFEDADARLREALPRLDFEPANSPDRTAALEDVLDTARPRDGLTLWHLLFRVRPDERGRVFDRLAQLVPPGQGVTREGVLRGDRAMAEAWWDQLGLEPLSWWRVWERPWTGEK